MSELSQLLGQFQTGIETGIQNEFGSEDGSTQKYNADAISNFANAYGQNSLLERKQEKARAKASAEAEKKRLAEEKIRNNSNALRLFNLKGGAALPEKDPLWTPQEKRLNPDELAFANEGSRKEYNVLFAENKIKEENSSATAASKSLTEKWYQEYLTLEDTDPLKGDYTSYAAHKASEYQSERFTDNLNGLSEISEANKRTNFNLSVFDNDIAKQQQEHIERGQAEFLDNYVDTDYQGGGSGDLSGQLSGPHPRGLKSTIRKIGPPRTPNELLALINKMQAKVNKGNGFENLYSKDQLHDAVIDNYTQRYLLAKTSDNPIFDAQQLFSSEEGMKLTDLQGGIGEKYRALQQGLYNRFVKLRKAEEKAAEDAEKKHGEDLDTIAYGTVTDISQLHQEAIDNPGTVTAVQIENLETILLSHDEQGAFSSKTGENEFSEAREQISAIRKLIDKTSTTYIPVTKETDALDKFVKDISIVTTTTALKKLHIEAINDEPNPWLSTKKIQAVAAQLKVLKDFSSEDKISPEQQKQSNSAMHTALTPIREAHFLCINEGNCESYNNLTSASAPEGLLEGDHKDFKKHIAKWDEEQGKAGTNTVKVKAAKDASLINQELGAGKFSLLKARQEFKKLKNPTETQIGAFDIAVRQHNERVATKSKKVFADNSLVEKGDVFDDIDSVETLEALDIKKDEIPLNLKLTGDDKRSLQKKVNTKRKEIEVKVAKDKDISQSADINQQLLDFTNGEITNETLKGIQTKVDGMTWHGNAGSNFTTFITGLIHKNVSAEKSQQEIETYNKHHSDYQTVTNDTEQKLNKIVKSVTDGNLDPEQAATDINNLEQDFNTNNKPLLEAGNKIKYKTNHKDLFTKAKKDLGTGDTSNRERKNKQKLIEQRQEEVQSLKDYKSDEKLSGISLITKAIQLKTPEDLIAYKEKHLNFSNDSDAQALFVKEINDLIEKREKGIGTSKEEEARLSGLLKAEYLDRINNSSDITKLNALKPTIVDELGLKGQHAGHVRTAITNRILAINKTNTTNDSLTVANNIDKTLFSIPIINQGSLDAALTKAETIKDPDIRRTTISQLRGIKGKLDNRSFNSVEFKKKLELKFKTNSYLSTIKSKILDHVTKAKHANLNFTVETSDTTVKKAITDLNDIFTTFKGDQVFLDTMEDSGTADWNTEFTKGIAELKELESKVSEQATAKIHLAEHNVSLKSREADRSLVQNELLDLQENYTADAHTDLEIRIKSFGADYVDVNGEISEVALFKNKQQAQLLKAANVAKELTSKAPKETDQTTLTTFYRDYDDKLSGGMEKPQELIKAGKVFLQDELVAKRITNSDYKTFGNMLNSFTPKAIKTQDGRLRAIATLDSIFRTSNTEAMLNPKFMIAVKGQGSWQEGNMLKEELHSKFDREWQAKAGSFGGDKTKSYEWATEYARSLISIDEKINPLDIKIIQRIRNWTGGAFNLGKKDPTDKEPAGNIKKKEQSETTDLVDQILNR